MSREKSAGSYVLTGSALSRSVFDTALELTGKQSPVVVIDRSACPAYAKQQPSKAWLSIHNLLSEEKGLVVHDLEASIAQASHSDDVLAADLLYVSGGSTRLARKTWQQLHLTDTILNQVNNKQLVAMGASAGAMIWFDQGYSDSYHVENPDKTPWRYINAAGVGVLPGYVTAHYNDTDDLSRRRDKRFRRFLRDHAGEWQQAFGLDTHGALVCIDGIATAMDIHTPEQQTAQQRASQSVHYFSSDTGISPRRMEQGEILQLARA